MLSSLQAISRGTKYVKFWLISSSLSLKFWNFPSEYVKLKHKIMEYSLFIFTKLINSKILKFYYSTSDLKRHFFMLHSVHITNATTNHTSFRIHFYSSATKIEFLTSEKLPKWLLGRIDGRGSLFKWEDSISFSSFPHRN